MKKLFLISLLGITFFSSCTKEKNLYDPEAALRRDGTSATTPRQNFSTVFGFDYSDTHDWSSVTSSTVTVTPDAALDDVVKVQILSASPFGNAKCKVLNEAEVTGRQPVTLSYDAPTSCNRLFAACVNKEGYYYVTGFAKGQPSVSFSKPSSSRSSLSRRAYLNASELVLARCTPSYNNVRTVKANEGETANSIDLWKDSGWQNDTCWALSDAQEKTLMANAPELSDDERADLEAIIYGYLTHEDGWYQDNVEKVRNSEIFKFGNNYLTSNGESGITLTPVQINGNETGYCHLFYYYYDPAQLEGKTEAETVQFLKSLPKYKAIQVWRTARQTGYSDKIFKLDSYRLVYWGDETPVLGQTRGVSYQFPKGYKIGFMFRKSKQGGWDQALTNYQGVANGEVYGDGRLNNEINHFPGHFGTARFETGDSRIAFFGANKKTYMSIEDGSNRDYGDIVIEVEGGVEPIDEPQSLDRNVYTYCFEDREIGDYDLNDVVIKAQRLDATHVKYSLEACGANDRLFLRNISGAKLNGSTEVHALFGVPVTEFVNTRPDVLHVSPVQDTVTVDPSFSFADAAHQLYIYNATTGSEVRVAQQGTDPHGLLIPYDYQYSVEFTNVGKAYPDFITWAKDRTLQPDWYQRPVPANVYTESVFR